MTQENAKPYVSLHTHSYYSILGALASPGAILDFAENKGYPAVALTDTNHGYGLLDAVIAAKGKEVKPILGAELSIALQGRLTEGFGMHPQLLVILAENQDGYKNLLKLLSIASLESGNDGRPRIDLQDLEKYKKGIIALTGGARGIINGVNNTLGEVKAEETLLKLLDIFGKEHFYGELVAKNDEETLKNNQLIEKLCEKHQIKKVITPDARYLEIEDEEPTEILGLIGRGGSVADPHRSRPFARSHFKSWEEIMDFFPKMGKSESEEIRKRTMAIAERVKVKIKFGESKLPNFEVPDGETEASILEKRCKGFVPEKYGKLDAAKAKEINERIDYELEIINKMGFAAYFLIVEDLIKYAKDKGIAVGPGRGSAAGSIVSYLLDITTVDPIKYELLFERFLNPARISMPDIDIDFSDERREEVMEYVIEKYGTDKVSKVCTFGTLSAKAALKDVGRALGVEFGQMNALTKSLPAKPGFELKDAEDIEEFTKMLSRNPGLNKVYDIAKKVEGVVRHVSVHACAVIIAKDDLTKNAPLQWSPTDDQLKITQYPYQQLESIGLLKMDFLGLRNLSIMEKALQIIKKTTGKDIVMEDIKMDDKNTFEMLSRGETTGVFQFESMGMRRYLKELKPTEFEDLVAMNALYRPGPMQFIPQYIEGKHHPEKVKYFHPDLEPLLKKTYGIAVYQEQILKIAQAFAGFSLGEADLLRKAIGKKIEKVLMKQKKKFIEGAMEKGYDESLAIKMFDDVIVPFSGYGFNRSHAVCYSRIAYETAYLRANFPVEFMTALMTTDRNNTERVVLEMRECEDMGIVVLPPDINQSDANFTVVENPKKDKDEKFKTAIRFGLTAIKGLGEDTTEKIMEERQKEKYLDISDFVSRVPAKLINKKTLEALTYSGSLDAFGDRGDLNASIEPLSKFAKTTQEKANSGQVGLFGGIDEAEASTKFALTPGKADKLQILTWEKQVMGLYISGHPLKPWQSYFEKNGTLINQIKEDMDKQEITIHGQIIKRRRLRTRKGDAMAIIEIEDTTGAMEVPLFPRVYDSIDHRLLDSDKVMVLKGKVSVRDGEINVIGNKLSVCTTRIDSKSNGMVITLPQSMSKSVGDSLKLYLKEKESPTGESITIEMNGRKMPVPFKVDVSGEFISEVRKLVEGVEIK